MTASLTLLSLECFLENIIGPIRGLTFVLYNARSGAFWSLALYIHTSKINSLMWYTGDYTRWIYLFLKEIEIFILLLHCGNLYKILSGLCRYFWACLHACKSGCAYSLTNCVPSLNIIDSEGFFVGRIILFLQHEFGFYSGKPVILKFPGLVCICQWLNGFLALPLCNSNYTNVSVNLKWLCLWAPTELIFLLNNEGTQVFHIFVCT